MQKYINYLCGDKYFTEGQSLENIKRMHLIIIIVAVAALVLTGCFGVNKINNVADDSAIDENAPNTESPAGR